MKNKIKSFGISLFPAGVLILGALMVASTANAAEILVHKTPLCGCCSLWVDHLKAEGFEVDVEDHDDLSAIKAAYGIPGNLQSCHTAIVEGYIIEGHVPAEDIRRLLAERPEAIGLAVPGMPLGSPGMEVNGHKQPYDVILFGQDDQTIFAKH